MSLLSNLPQYWMDGAIRALEGFRRGLSEPFPLSEDPPAVTSFFSFFAANQLPHKKQQKLTRCKEGEK